MVTLTALFRAPKDAEAFEKHYAETHTPLVKQMEGIRKIEVTRFAKMLTPSNETLGAQPHLMCTMYFDDEQALNNGMRSPGGKAASKDLMSFAGDLVSMVTGTVEETPM